MANLPLPLEQREELDCRLGIKSSLSNIPSVIALSYALYCANEKKSEIVYADETKTAMGRKSLILKSNYADWIKANYSVDDTTINANPLLTSQLEALQVGLELMFHLAKVSYVDYPNTDTKERTGGERYRKLLEFATNMKLLDVYLSAWNKDDVKQELSLWLKNKPSDSAISKGLKEIITTFTEDTQFKIRVQQQEIVFQQDGIYKTISAESNVVAKDEQEDVGPFRVFKSFVREGLHPYLTIAHNEFSCNDTEDFRNYRQMVETALRLSPRKTYIYTEIPAEIQDLPNTAQDSRQIIYYGAPGTGKSYAVKRITGETDGGEKENVFRTTFHPDTDYASFVGCYKPAMTEVEEKYRAVAGHDREISYEFVPQVFTEAYVYAYENPTATTYLVIEEINRGNCAQIFGDLFQLLDRNEEGVSEYAIRADVDLKKHLESVLGKDSEGIRGGKLRLPENLHILATMNTSDQSLFPMDSAFKRRWDWQYVPISYTEEKSSQFEIDIDGEKYSWVEFIKAVNEKIVKITQSEDKQMGNFFIKSSVGAEQFKSKVMFYLWNEVLRDETENSNYFFYAKNEDGQNRKFTFKDLYEPNANEILKRFIKDVLESNG